MTEVTEKAYQAVDVTPTIFRAYDIRGCVDPDLTPEVVYTIGLAFGSEALSQGQDTVVIARDGRLSGPALTEALSAGLRATGCKIIQIGAVPTPVLYFATAHFKTGTGIMITGSHNPPEYNGLKMMIGGKTLAGADIQSLLDRIRRQSFAQGTGQIEHQPVVAHYIKALIDQAQLARPLKVVVDGGNGVAGELTTTVLEKLGCQVTPLYCEMDGDFPNHHPNPSDPKNLNDLIAKVAEEKADIGLALDGDGDRLGVITAKGDIIWPDRLMMLFAQSVLKEKPGSPIIFDVKCSRYLSDIISQAGGKPIMSKTGHSFIKRAMQTHDAALAGEMSGHFFFKDRWYGFDDACYAGVRLLEILAQEDDAQKLWDSLPTSYHTPELNVAISDEHKFEWIQGFIEKSDFPGGNCITLDGLRVEWPDGWGLIRVSNTTPALVVRFEAESPEALARIQNIFCAKIQSFDKTIEISQLTPNSSR
jgi:phosphomannomutase/phosphoglucomutase